MSCRIKRIVILFLFALICISVFPESFTGVWEFKQFLCKSTEAVLIPPDEPYSYPYSGIIQINFIDESFSIISLKGDEVRTFYDIKELSGKNYIITFTFKTGFSFKVQTVKIEPGKHLYVYKLGSPPFQNKEEDINKEETALKTDDENQAEYIGTMIKIR